jgi:hypothetical protein
MEKLSLHWGLKKIAIGALLLLNALVWPKWLGIDGWIKFAAVLLIIGGLIKLVHPRCGMPVAKNVKKKKK